MVQTPVRGLITLVAFADGEEVVEAFESVLRRHRYSNLKSFYLNCRSHGDWLELILSHCLELDAEEVTVRVRACKTGGVATAVCLIGSRHQVMLFPSKYELVSALIRERRGERKNRKNTIGLRLGSTLGYETESSEDEDVENGHVDASSSNPLLLNDEHDSAESDKSALVRQVILGFGNWLERLADGSLRRYSIQEWPDWTLTT